MTDMRAIEIVAADFAAFGRVFDRVLGAEIESFQGLSGQYGLHEDMDALLKRAGALNLDIGSRLEALRSGTAGELPTTDVRLLDALLEQLDRFVVVADLRGATLTSGDLLQKLQGWIVALRGWLAGVSRQLEALT